MRALIQRVNEASVLVDGEVVGAIGTGLCVFIGASHDDDLQKAEKMASKIWNLRVFEDEDQRMNKSLGEAGGEVLVVSQFTLYGDTSKGRRPGWSAAAAPDHAEPLIERVVEGVKAAGVVVETGRFREHMQVELINDGPATLMIEI